MTDEALSHAIIDFANALEAACVQLKRYIGEQHGVGMKEGEFLGLNWEKQQGNRLGEFETATNESNTGPDFPRCLDILKAHGATIKGRFHEKGWRFAYWLYSEKAGTIYRQALKQK